MDRVRIQSRYSQKKNLAGRWRDTVLGVFIGALPETEDLSVHGGTSEVFFSNFWSSIGDISFAQHHPMIIIQTAFVIIEK